LSKLSGSIPSVDPDDLQVDLGLLAQRLWSGKWRILAITVAAALLGILIAFLRTPIYQADALLQLEEKKGSLALPEGMSELMSNEPVSNTEIEIIRSRLVIGQAVAVLHLDWLVEPKLAPVVGSALMRFDGIPFPDGGWFRRYNRLGDSIRLDFLQVPPEWLDEAMTLTVGENGTFVLELPDDTLLEAGVGNRLVDQERGFTIQIGALDAPAGRQYSITQIEEMRAIQDLRETLSVAERGRNSGVIELRLNHKDRDLAQRIVVEISQAYLEQNLARSAAEADSSLEFIRSQIPDAQAKLAAAEQALNDYMTAQQTVDLSLETEGILTQSVSLEAELREIARREDELKQRYTPNHPLYQRLLEEKRRVEERLASLRQEVEGLPETQQELLNLTRTLEFEQEVYVQLLNRAQELQVVRASSIGSVRIIDTARTAPKSVEPRIANVILTTTAIGFALAIAYVLIRGWLQKGVQSAESLEKLGVPVFATINLSPAPNTNKKSRGNWPILAITDPTDLTVEGLRSLRTSLHFGMLDAATKSLSITSSAPGAGKSFTSINLATVAAQSGMNVCLIDADMRRGTLRRYLGVEKGHAGLAELLAGRAKLDDVIVKHQDSGLSFIATGRFPPNPSELLMRSDFQNLIEELNKRFDLTLVDSPPVLAVTDPIIIGRAVGANIAIVRHLETPMGEVQAMLRILESSKVPLSGIVLNGFDPRKVEGENFSYRYDYKQRDE
jgi:tyrosine-protein kinase Etk/Wzc